MIFDLSTMHLGDVLMALPAMRDTDAVIAQPRHRVPGAPVAWLAPDDAPAAGRVYPAMRRGRHTTDAWLDATGRSAVRHRLLYEPHERVGTVICPDVSAASKQWPRERWESLWREIPDAHVVTSAAPRGQWMQALNTADTVICPDTGTAHMADALGCPRVIVLHGIPGNWPHCAPYWDRRYCIARASMDDITVEEVLEVARG